MRVIACLLIYLVVVFLGGALMAPWLYEIARWAAGQWPVLAGLARQPFHRFVIRSVLALAVIGLWPLLRHFKMLSAHEIGLSDSRAGMARRAVKHLALGFSIGLISLAAVALLSVLFGNRTMNLDHSASETFRYLVGATVAAILVASLEELMFRGALYGIMRLPLGRPAALMISSVIYATVHFVQKAEAARPVDWQSGLLLLAPMFRNLGDTAFLIPAWFTLAVVGAILALLYERTGTLYTSIGLHGGWIFWLKSYRFTTRSVAGTVHAFWGSDNLVDGWLALIIISTVLIIALAVAPRSRSQN